MNSPHKIVVLSILMLCAAAIVPAQENEREKGLELYEQGEYQKAVEILEKVRQSNAADSEARRFLAMAHARLDNEKEARKAFKEAEEIKDAAPVKTFDSPAKIILKRPPQYTEQARRNFTTGKIKLYIEFTKKGEIGYIFAFNKLPDGLTESAIEAARQIKFEPAVRNGQKVTVIKRVEFTFSTL